MPHNRLLVHPGELFFFSMQGLYPTFRELVTYTLVAAVLAPGVAPYRPAAAFLLPHQTPEDVQWTRGFPLFLLLPTSSYRSILWRAWQDVHARPNLRDGLCPRRQRPNPEAWELQCRCVHRRGVMRAWQAAWRRSFHFLSRAHDFRPPGDSARFWAPAASSTLRHQGL